MSASLVGSEMCIRDSSGTLPSAQAQRAGRQRAPVDPRAFPGNALASSATCLLYTSDAADDM
eukprot:8319551-Alexandrium_andersonii.AAC.1